MSLTRNDLLAISDLLDMKLEPINQRLTSVENRLTVVENRLTSLENEFSIVKDRLTSLELDSENVIKPTLHLLAENYVPAAKRYEEYNRKVDFLQSDVDVLKEVVSSHSKILQHIS